MNDSSSNPARVDESIAEDKDCWYCEQPLLEGVPVSVQGLFLAHDSCRPTYQDTDTTATTEETPTMNDTELPQSYPTRETEDLLRTAEQRFIAECEDHGTDKNWLRDQARWHIWKACDELFQARDAVHNDQYNDALNPFADALNHMLFAMEITRIRWERDTSHN